MDWSRSYVMGVVNVTPDSFSDGGRFFRSDDAIVHGRGLRGAGADILDVGGESTRPGAAAVSAEQQIERVLPVVRALAASCTVSIDTCKAKVAAAAIDAGAEIVNDVSGGRIDPGLFEVAAKTDVALILGHLRGRPENMQEFAAYKNVMQEVIAELSEQVEVAVRAGVPREKILVDPGLGFAKNAAHNCEILARLGELRSLGCAVVIGASRKTFLGQLTGRASSDREVATAAANVAAILAGANIARVHDVAGQLDAVRVADAIADGVMP